MRATELTIAFCLGFATAGLVFIVLATISACSPLGRPFSDREVQLHETERQIQLLEARRASILKAIEDERKAK